MKKFIQHNRIFFSLYLLFLIVGAILIVCMERGNEILFFNSMHTPLLDLFFKYATQLAEAPLLLLPLIIIILFSYGKGIVLVLNTGLVYLVTGILKFFVFETQVRPSVFFEGKVPLNFVQGVEVMHYNSFPSGHTAAAFGLFCMLSLFVNKKKWSAVFFLLALLVGLSRVYLLQHFFRDIYAGSLVGVGISSLFYLTFVRSAFYNSLHWKDKALLKW